MGIGLDEIDIQYIERLYKEHKNVILKIELLQPRFTPILSQTPGIQTSGNSSPVEDLATQRADLRVRKEIVVMCMEAMNNQEREFITGRYFDEFAIERVADIIHVSRKQAYRIRDNVIIKTAYLLGMKSKESA